MGNVLPKRCFQPKENSKGDEDESDPQHKLAGGNVQLVTTEEEWKLKMEEAKKDGKQVVANFSASWCGPCQEIAQLYAELSEKYPSLMFLTVDVDQLTDFSTALDIKATPTFFFFKPVQGEDEPVINKDKTAKLVGANKGELKKKITEIVDTPTPSEK
ncbi:hypothetical protein DM860_002750 [Cuscuta australis]|uniref:Thioredoxin domain-containing protein n=1 Tax=Cuscuta australis TaxID=267555 RepID=A0A328D0D9_9ASTE|nr:hypothetical protein DM860_002750 [Cuscuta australis]